MSGRLGGTLAIAVLLAASASRSGAQVTLGYTDVGGVIGFGNLGNASVSVGGRGERVFRKLPDLADGLLGIGVSVDIYSRSDGLASLRAIPIGATANYHFKLDPKNRFDAFVGAGLGLRIVTCDFPGTSAGCNGYDSGLYLIARVGGRYFLKPNLAVYADAGAGAATVSAGLTFKLKK